MPKVILSMMVSLDGSIARANGDLGWFVSDPQFEQHMLGLLRSVEAMFFGRVSYDLLAQYWPNAGKPGSEKAPGGFSSQAIEEEFAHLMNTVPKVVFSRTARELAWGPSRLVRSNVGEEVAQMKREAKKDLVLFAGASLATTFMNLDLVDEYQLMVHPIVLASGVGLFAGVEKERALRLEEARSFSSGVVLARYARARAT